MGLDMYLYRKSWVNNGDWIKPEFKEEIEMTRGGNKVDTSKIRYIIEEVGYWRKANAIHRWFVENVQKGNDDCEEYFVPNESLSELRSICKKVLEDLEKDTNTLIAEQELPTQSGFFFGSTTYDSWYVEDLKNTISIIDEALAEDRGDFYYRSSW